MTANWPKAVREMHDAAAQAGFSPQVEGHPGGDWEVFVEGEHIRASAFYSFRNGKTRHSGSKLTVDGKEHRSASDMTDLRKIWDRYENGAAPAVLAVIEDPGETPVPRRIQEVVDLIAKRGLGHSVRVGLSGGQWVIGIDIEGGTDGLRIFTAQVHGDWQVNTHLLQLVLDGEDRSHEVHGDLSKALELMGNVPSPEAPAPPSSAFRKQTAKRDTGVEMRKGNVIRV